MEQTADQIAVFQQIKRKRLAKVLNWSALGLKVSNQYPERFVYISMLILGLPVILKAEDASF
jgi:hypothetical protein